MREEREKISFFSLLPHPPKQLRCKYVLQAESIVVPASLPRSSCKNYGVLGH